MNAHTCISKMASRPSLDPRAVYEMLDQLSGALADINGSLKFCETSLLNLALASELEQFDELRKAIIRIGGTLSTHSRLIEWELTETDRYMVKANAACGGAAAS